MAIAKGIHRYVRVVPVRFDRCPDAADPNVEQAGHDANAPDPDDRGFSPSAVRGAILPVGMDDRLEFDARPETRCRLIRMDIEDAARLFVTTSRAGIVDITLPVNNAALPNTTRMMIRLKARAAGNTLLQVRFGAIDGPIIHQMQVLVTTLFRLRVAAHAPTINGVAQIDASTGAAVPAQTVRTDAQIRAMFDVANAIYFNYGIRFVPDAVIDRAGVLALGNQGMVDDLTNEFSTCTASNRVARTVNAYFVPQIANPVGGANATPLNQVSGVANSAVRNPNTFGLLVSDSATSGATIAHELGHLLNLPSDPQRRFIHIDRVVDAALPGTGRAVRSDLVSRRRLMLGTAGFRADAQRPYRDQVGYGLAVNGNGLRGGMLTIKQYDADRTDLELGEVTLRSRALTRAP